MIEIRAFFKKNVAGMILAALMAMLGIVIDGIVIARYLGPQSMAAYGLITPLTNMGMMCSAIFSSGTQILCAQRIGADDKKGARRIFSMCVLATLVLTLGLMLLLFFGRDSLAVMLGATGDAAGLLPLCSDYMFGMLFSIPFVFFLLEFNGLMRLDGDSNRIIIAVVAMTILDVSGDFLNALVIHGGMFGMGLTSSISYCIAFLLTLPHFRRKDIIFRFSLKGLRPMDLWDILVTGSSSALGFGSSILRSRALNELMLASTAAITATAALSIMNNVLNVTSSTMAGMGNTCSMMAGLIYGKKDRLKAEELLLVTMKYALSIAAIFFVLLFPFAPVVTQIFTGKVSGDIATYVIKGMRIYAAGVFLYGINAAYISYTQGMRRIAYANTITFLENFAFIVLPALLLFRWLDADAVWVSFPATEILTFIFIYLTTSLRRGAIPTTLKDFTYDTYENINSK